MNENSKKVISNVNSKRKKERNVPDLRFENSSYKSNLLGDLFIIERGGSPRPINNYISKNGTINWIKISDGQENGYIETTKEKILALGLNKTREVYKGDLILSNSMSYGKPYILKINGCIHDGWLVLRNKKNEFNMEYMRQYLQTSICKNQYKRMAAGGVVNNLNKDLVSNVLINYPSLSEQNKIAHFLAIIDSKIETQKKIIEDLLFQKICIVNNIYKNMTYNCKLSNIISQISKRNKNDDISNILSVNNKYGFIKQSEQYEGREIASDDVTYYKIVEKDVFAYNPARINVGSIAKYNNDEKGIISPMYICFKVDKQLDPEYLNYYFLSSNFKREMVKRLEGSVRQCLTYESLANIPFHLPALEKQKKNATIIAAFNNKINFEKKYLRLLEIQKAYLLTKMFI